VTATGPEGMAWSCVRGEEGKVFIFRALLLYEMLFHYALKISETQYLPSAASLLGYFSLLQNDLVLFVLVGQYD